MADRYLKATGNWADNNTWSATDGGDPGETFPTSGDNAYLTAEGNGLTLTLGAAAACDTLVCSGGCTTTLAGTNTITVGGDATLLSTMTIVTTWTWVITGTGNLLASGITTLGAVSLNGTAHTISGNSTFVSLTIAGTATVTLGATTQTTGAWICAGTIVANTSTIIVTGTGVFTGGGETYNEVQLNGSAHTIAGSNTFAALTFKADTTQTITFTDGTTQTVTTPTITGLSGKIKTLVGTSTAGWIITKVGGGTVTADYLALSYSEGRPQRTWIAGIHSVDTILNTGWLFGRDWAEHSGAGWWVIRRTIGG